MLRFLQDSPHFLEVVYRAVYRMLLPFRRWLKPGGRAEWLFIRLERLTKIPLFDCRMCGQCILHSTGMTCPMTCPKNLRNGPCGGVRLNGERVSDKTLLLAAGDTLVLQVGKRKFARVTLA